MALCLHCPKTQFAFLLLCGHHSYLKLVWKIFFAPFELQYVRGDEERPGTLVGNEVAANDAPSNEAAAPSLDVMELLHDNFPELEDSLSFLMGGSC